MATKPRVAVVLFNLGGPDSPDSVEPFLFNLFNDKAIISLPGFMRYPLAKLISKKRAPLAQEIYAHLGGGSPLLPLTEKQAQALKSALPDEWESEVFICMRYWHPISAEVAKQVKSFAPDHIIALPLYPQFSTTTTGSSFKDWQFACRKLSMKVGTSSVCCYPILPDFIEAHASMIIPVYEQAKTYGKPRILFSAHGLPEKVIHKGDPYQWQVEQTAMAIVKKLAIDGLDWQVCYQSRVGPLKWIGPSTDDEIHRGGKNGVPLVVAPVAFVSEHSETLVELDIEYAKLAKESNVPYYGRVPALGDNPHYIKALAEVCVGAYGSKRIAPAENAARYCPADRRACPCKQA